jgi:hypothetical protein
LAETFDAAQPVKLGGPSTLLEISAVTGRIVLVSDDVVAGRDYHLEGESSAKWPPFASHVRVVLLRQRDSRKDVRWPLVAVGL